MPHRRPRCQPGRAVSPAARRHVVAALALAAAPALQAGAEGFDPDEDLLLAATTRDFAAADGRSGARDDSFYVSASVSTLGIGVDFSRSVARRFAVRLSANAFSFAYDDTASDIDYELDLELRSFGAHLEWHPGGGGAWLAGGVLFNGNELNALGQPDGPTIDIGDVTFDTAQVGRLTGAIGFADTAPVVGAGWNGAFAGRRIGLNVGVGVVFQGEPSVSLAADGPIADEPLFQAELERERADLEDDLGAFRYYPVATLGVTFRF